MPAIPGASILDYVSGFGDLLHSGFNVLDAFGQQGSNEDALAIMQQQFALQQQQAARAWELATAPRTDAYGNTTGYESGSGFYTNVAPAVQALLNAELGELTQRQTTDAAIRRGGLLANSTRRQNEGVAADEALAALRFSDRYDRDGVIGDLTESTLRALQRGTDDIVNPALTQLTRLGDSTTAGNMLNRVAEANSDRVSDAILNSRIQGNQLYEALAGSRASRLGNEYNMLASRASNFDDVAFIPQNISGNLAGTQGSMPGMALGASQLGMYGTQGAANALYDATVGGAPKFGDIGKSLGDLITGFGGFSELSRGSSAAERLRGSSGAMA